MTPQEQRLVTSMATQITIFAVYAIVVLGHLGSGRLAEPDGFVFIGRSVVALMAATIVVTIIIQIVLAIVMAVRTGADDHDFIEDERDKLIQLKGMRVSHLTFSIAFVLTMIALALGLIAPTIVLLTIVTTMFFSSVLSEVVRLVYYRREA